MEIQMEEDARARVVRPMAERAMDAKHDFAVELAKRAHQVIPELPTSMLDTTVASAEAGIDDLMSMVIGGIDPTGYVPSPEVRSLIPQKLVEHGLPADLALRMSRSSHSALLRRWLIELRSESDEHLALSAENYTERFLLAWFDAMDRQWLSEYNTLWERHDIDAETAREDLIRSILSGTAHDIAESSRRLGYRLEGPHRGFVIWCRPDADGSPPSLTGTLRAVPESFRARAVTLRLDEETVAGWVASSDPLPNDEVRLHVRRAGRSLRLAFGSVHEGLSGFARTHQEALETKRVVDISDGRLSGPVHDYRDIAFAALATADIEGARRFVAAELGRLAGQDDDTLRIASTLRVYFAEMGTVARTARRLGIHKNTVLYRLQQAEALLGRSLDDRRLELQLALDLARTIGVPPPA
jgi:hypothetical protein